MTNRLEKLRKQKGLTLKELALDLVKSGYFEKITDATLSNYENEKREPKLDTWDKLADYFEAPVPYLQGTTADNENPIQRKIDYLVQKMTIMGFDILFRKANLTAEIEKHSMRFKAFIDNGFSDTDALYLLDELYAGIEAFKSYTDGTYTLEGSRAEKFNAFIKSYNELSEYANEKLNVFKLQLGMSVHFIPRDNVDEFISISRDSLNKSFADVAKHDNLNLIDTPNKAETLNLALDKFSELVQLVTDTAKKPNAYAELVTYSIADDILTDYLRVIEKINQQIQ